MRARSEILLASLGVVSLGRPALAGPPPLIPTVGDVLRYEVSTGQRVTLRTVRVLGTGEKTVATEEETVRSDTDGVTRQSTFDVIRTQEALAFDVPQASDNAKLSPLVYFFSPANIRDSWLAQRGAFLDRQGKQVQYQIVVQVEAIETISSPAGVFPGCYRLGFTSSLDQSSDRNAMHLTMWLKPDLGIVKTRSQSGNAEITTELVSFDKSGYVRR